MTPNHNPSNRLLAAIPKQDSQKLSETMETIPFVCGEPFYETG